MRWGLLLPHRDSAVAVVARATGDVAEAEDCVHDAMARLVRRADLGPRGVRRLLVGTALHSALDARGRSLRERAAIALLSVGADWTVAPDALVIARAEAALVLATIRELPHREREVVMLRLVDGLTTEEVAAALGVTRKTVEGALSHGRQRVRLRLARRGLR